MVPPSLARVLIVDDNRQMRIIVRELLRALGMRQCVEAGSAKEALAQLQRWKADLIITDLILDGEDGLALAKRIRMDPDSPNNTVPIVMMTGHAEMSRVAAAIDAGCNTFLAKPISPRSLAHHVSAALKDRRHFVRTNTFFGPDRRRRSDPDYKGPWRRTEDNDVSIDDELPVAKRAVL
jgi:CheY-like chemotaxis protein